MKSVRVNANTQEINWSKIQLLTVSENNIIVLTNGNHEGDTFEGTVVFRKDSPCSIGDFSSIWDKKAFSLYNNVVQLSND